MHLQAQEMYGEALRHCDTHVPSMLAMAKLALASGDVDACQSQCVSLLKADPDNEEASIMLAELMFHKVWNRQEFLNVLFMTHGSRVCILGVLMYLLSAIVSFAVPFLLGFMHQALAGSILCSMHTPPPPHPSTHAYTPTH